MAITVMAFRVSSMIAFEAPFLRDASVRSEVLERLVGSGRWEWASFCEGQRSDEWVELNKLTLHLLVKTLEYDDDYDRGCWVLIASGSDLYGTGEERRVKVTTQDLLISQPDDTENSFVFCPSDDLETAKRRVQDVLGIEVKPAKKLGRRDHLWALARVFD